MWDQHYDPFSNQVLSTLAAALPVVTLLVLIATNKVKAHIAAVIALVVANLVAIFFFTMPANMSLRATVLGAVTGFFPIGWIVLNVIFLYRLTVEKGVFQTLQTTIGGVTTDRRLQLLLIAFCFGAFFEGASGFGTPVAVTGAILIGLGFSPLAASGLSLIANTAPVAYGALGTPIQGLASVMANSPEEVGPLAFQLGAMVGRQLPFFSLIVPFWLIWAFAGWKGMKDVWPAILVTGVSRDKKAGEIVGALAPAFDAIVATAAHHKGAEAHTIAAAARLANPRAKVEVAATMEDAVRLSQESATSQKQRVYVAGGLFLAIEYATIVKGGRAEDLDFF